MKKNPSIKIRFSYSVLGTLFICLATASSIALGSENSGSGGNILTTMRSAADARGFTFTGEYTGEAWGNLSGGIKQGATYEGLLKLTQQLDLQKFVGWSGATIYASWFYPHGEGLDRQYSGTLNLLSSITAYNSFRLSELWFQQKLLGDTVSIRIGQLASDLEFYQSRDANLFVNSCFGTFPTISFGTNLPIYPVGGLGARVDFHPCPSVFARVAVLDSNPGQQNTNDKYGTLFHLNPSAGVIVIAEAVYQINPTVENRGSDQAYTIGGYYDSRKITGDFTQPTHYNNCGFYAIADYRLYRKTPYVNEQSSNAGLSGFASCSGALSDRNEISFYADTGINYSGLIPGRDKDLLGLAVSYSKISSHYVVDGFPVRSGHETIVEGTYRYQVNDQIYLQPDLQYIFDPGAFQHHSNAFVAGLRFDVTF